MQFSVNKTTVTIQTKLPESNVKPFYEVNILNEFSYLP